MAEAESVLSKGTVSLDFPYRALGKCRWAETMQATMLFPRLLHLLKSKVLNTFLIVGHC